MGSIIRANRDRLWLICLLIGTLGLGTYPLATSTVIKSYISVVYPLLPVLTISLALWLFQPRHRGIWYALALGNGFVAGGALYRAVCTTLNIPVALPSVADLCYVLGYLSILYAVIGLTFTNTSGGEWIVTIDAGLVAAGLGGILWATIITPILQDQALPVGGRLVAASYQVLDIVIFAVVVQLLMGFWQRPVVLRLLAAAFGINFFADILYSIALTNGGYSVNAALNVFWLLANLLTAVAALHPSIVAKPQREMTNDQLTPARVVLHGISGLSMPGLMLGQYLLNQPVDVPVIAVTWSVMVLLTLIRVMVLLRSLQQREAYYRALVQDGSDVVAVVDERARIRYISPSLERILGHSTRTFTAQPLLKWVHPDDSIQAQRDFRRLVENPGITQTIMVRLKGDDGEWRHLELAGTNLLKDSSVQGILLNARDVTARKIAEVRLEHQAFHDMLTNLPNRALFVDRLGQALQRTSQHQSHLAVLFLDLDLFKTVNDTMGHSGGDQLLVAVAARLRQQVAATATVARFGGDEFTVLIEDIADDDAAVQVAERILASFREPIMIGDRLLTVGTSIGIVVDRGGKNTASDLLRYADVALYEAKGAGKNCYALFDVSMSVAAVERATLLAELRWAIKRDELVLHYQPLVDLHTRQVVGLEALVRWQHPVRGLVQPGVFIPLAEESGVIIQLGDWVMRAAAKQLRQWREVYGADCPRVSINISPRRLQQGQHLQALHEIIAEEGISPAMIELELTESALLEDTEQITAMLQELRDQGFSLALDDFGTGYASLTHLHRFPIDTVKIDRSFVRDLGQKQDGEVIVQTMLDLAERLGMRVVAEGVETAAQVQYLQNLGCAVGQGFYFSRPQPAAQIAPILAAGGMLLTPPQPASKSSAGLLSRRK